MYRHAWESILSFCNLSDLTRAARVQRMTLSAAREMHSIQHKIVYGFTELEITHKHALMVRHIGDVEIRVPFPSSFQAAAEKGIDVTIVQLSSWQMASESIPGLVEMFYTLKRMRELRLSYCNLGSHGIRLLSKFLATSSSLTCVDLMHNGMGDGATEAFSKALETNTSITSVRLDSNKIDDEEIVHLANALKINTNIQHISLQSNIIQCAGAVALASVLEISQTITSMDLTENCIGLQGASALIKALKTNTSLVEFHIQVNVEDRADGISISDAFKARFGPLVHIH